MKPINSPIYKLEYAKQTGPMKHQKQLRAEIRVNLRQYVGAEAWGTAKGAEVFSKLNTELLPRREGTLAVLDFAEVQRADVSFLREAIVEIIRKHRPRLLFIADHVSEPDLRANLESALTLRGESLLSRELVGYPEVLGKKLPKEHELTLRALGSQPEFTSGMLTAKPFGLESSTASARLSALWKAGLVERVAGTAPSGGREYKYFAIA
jgi:hypothetical protein